MTFEHNHIAPAIAPGAHGVACPAFTSERHRIEDAMEYVRKMVRRKTFTQDFFARRAPGGDFEGYLAWVYARFTYVESNVELRILASRDADAERRFEHLSLSFVHDNKFIQFDRRCAEPFVEHYFRDAASLAWVEPPPIVGRAKAIQMHQYRVECSTFGWTPKEIADGEARGWTPWPVSKAEAAAREEES